MKHTKIFGSSRVGVIASLLFAATAFGYQDEHRHYFDVPWLGYDTGHWPDAYYPSSAESVDMDADGYPDLVSVASGGFLSVMLADGKGGYLPFTMYPLLTSSRDIAVADFDNDGDPDVVSADTGGGWSGTTVSLYQNDGAGVLEFLGAYSIGNTGPNGITASDFDGDGCRNRKTDRRCHGLL